MRRSDVIVDEIARCLSAAKSPKELISALGMDSHPIIEEMKRQSRHPWDGMYREVLYHSDQHSLFRQRPPEIEYHDHMARVVPAPPPISEDTIADSLWKFAAIEHLVLGFKQQ